MKKARSKHHYLGIALIAAGVIALAALAIVGLDRLSSHGPKASYGESRYGPERDYWKSKIEELGTAPAYELFKKENESQEFGNAHALAHMFGELIYESEGLDGIAICDAAFSYGCYHSYFGRAIEDHGLDVVISLDKSCAERWGEKGLGCPHGIGHGLLGYLGDSGLEEALSMCDKLSWKGPIGGCTSGVFMEYNLRVMQNSGFSDARAYDPKRPYEPCDVLPSRFGQACYFELPNWWLRSMPNEYAKVGMLCQGVPEGETRKSCFRGLGMIVSPTEKYDVAKSIADCSLMPDHDSMVLCRTGASWSLIAYPATKAKAAEMCLGLKGEDLQSCRRGADVSDRENTI